jgi:hypothetical protein
MSRFPIVLILIAFTGAEEPKSTRWNFEDATVGKLPAGWTAAKTGKGPGSDWKVIEDKSAPDGGNVLAHTSSERPNPLFNLCVADETSYADIDLSVSFKAVEGKTDQGGGPVGGTRTRSVPAVAIMFNKTSRESSLWREW